MKTRKSTMNSQSMLFCNLCPTVANLHSGATVNRTEKEKHSHIDWIPTGIKESKMWDRGLGISVHLAKSSTSLPSNSCPAEGQERKRCKL